MKKKVEAARKLSELYSLVGKLEESREEGNSSPQVEECAWEYINLLEGYIYPLTEEEKEELRREGLLADRE